MRLRMCGLNGLTTGEEMPCEGLGELMDLLHRGYDIGSEYSVEDVESRPASCELKTLSGYPDASEITITVLGATYVAAVSDTPLEKLAA